VIGNRPVEARFGLAPGVRVKVFDDEAVVFNPFTWETHVLNPSATLVLERLHAGPCSRHEIEELLAEALSEDDRVHAAQHAKRLLDELCSLRLLEPSREGRA
jgi:PqqD family protein of HPr-rel-A system